MAVGTHSGRERDWGGGRERESKKRQLRGCIHRINTNALYGTFSKQISNRERERETDRQTETETQRERDRERCDAATRLQHWTHCREIVD